MNGENDWNYLEEGRKCKTWIWIPSPLNLRYPSPILKHMISQKLKYLIISLFFISVAISHKNKHWLENNVPVIFSKSFVNDKNLEPRQNFDTPPPNHLCPQWQSGFFLKDIFSCSNSFQRLITTTNVMEKRICITKNCNSKWNPLNLRYSINWAIWSLAIPPVYMYVHYPQVHTKLIKQFKELASMNRFCIYQKALSHGKNLLNMKFNVKVWVIGVMGKWKFKCFHKKQGTINYSRCD